MSIFDFSQITSYNVNPHAAAAAKKENEIFGQLLIVGFLTGSRAFGTEEEGSDWDIAINVRDTQKVDELLEGRSRTPSDYFTGYYLYFCDKKINIIPLHPHDYKAWYCATLAMRASFSVSGITNKMQKYALFQSFVATFKGLMQEDKARIHTVENHFVDNVINQRLPTSNILSIPFIDPVAAFVKDSWGLQKQKECNDDIEFMR